MCMVYNDLALDPYMFCNVVITHAWMLLKFRTVIIVRVLFTVLSIAQILLVWHHSCLSTELLGPLHAIPNNTNSCVEVCADTLLRKLSVW